MDTILVVRGMPCRATRLCVNELECSLQRDTRWFKYDRDDLCVNKSQFVPVIFEPPCTFSMLAAYSKVSSNFSSSKPCPNLQNCPIICLYMPHGKALMPAERNINDNVNFSRNENIWKDVVMRVFMTVCDLTSDHVGNISHGGTLVVLPALQLS